MYIISGARTPFSFYQTHLKLLKAHNLGATAVRALLSMVPGMDTTSVQKFHVATAHDIKESAAQIAQRSGMAVNETPVVREKGASFEALSAMCKEPPSSAGIVVGVEGGHNQPLSLEGKGYVVEKNAFIEGLLSKNAEALSEYCGYDVQTKTWDTWRRVSRDRAQEASKADVLLHEIAPIALSIEKNVKHIVEDCGIKGRRYKHDVLPGALQIKHIAPLCDGAAALCLSVHKGRDALGRIAEVYHAPPEPGGVFKSLQTCTRYLLDQHGIKAQDLHIVEIDEQALFTPYVCGKFLGVARENINRWGGACAIGYAGAASELRMVLAAAHGMMLLEQRWALVLCPGGDGSAFGLLLERDHERR